MLEWLKSRLQPGFLTFIFVRLAGVGIKPLVLLVAGMAAREPFARDYALLVSALAGLFVLAGAQTHIPYYNRRFSHMQAAYYKVFRAYFRDTLIQYLLVLPVVAAIGLLWTRDPVLLAAIVLLVGVEKFFDEDMRHFQFTREYYDWSTSFAFRTILPSLATLAILPFWPGRLIEAYTALSLSSLAGYGVLRHRHFGFYFALVGSFVRRGAGNALRRLGAFAIHWRHDLMFNQAWTYASINILLVDRLMIANIYPWQIAEYVFFANIFNLVNVAHSLFYFVPRRPELIKDPNTTAWNELSRRPNVIPPLGYFAVSLAIAWLTQIMFDTYRDVSPALFFGLGLFYVLQAINLVGIEFVFWRVSRRKLVLADGGILLAMAAAIYLLDLPLAAVPYITSLGLVLRMLLYQWLAKHGARGVQDTTQAG